MADIKVLIAAAGKGTRAGLPYPKTLYPVQGVPILLRILHLMTKYDASPTVIVSPEGEAPIRECLTDTKMNAHLVIQPQPAGMGDAVLYFTESPVFSQAEHVLLIWGDIPLIQSSTMTDLVLSHFERNNDFTFPTRFVDSAYTVVSRDFNGNVVSVVETREQRDGNPQAGERDIGLFLFRKEPIFKALQASLPGKFGSATGEHGFLYVIEHLVQLGLKVKALPIAKELDLVSLNSIKDLKGFE